MNRCRYCGDDLRRAPSTVTMCEDCYQYGAHYRRQLANTIRILRRCIHPYLDVWFMGDSRFCLGVTIDAPGAVYSMHITADGQVALPERDSDANRFSVRLVRTEQGELETVAAVDHLDLHALCKWGRRVLHRLDGIVKWREANAKV